MGPYEESFLRRFLIALWGGVGVGIERVRKQRNRQFKRIYYSIWFKHFKMREYVKYTSGSKAKSKIKPMKTRIFVSKLEKKN